MAKEKNYVVAAGRAISCKNGVIAEGEAISWRNMPDPLCKKGADKLDSDQMEQLKRKNFKALLNSDKVLVIEKKEPYVPSEKPPEVTEPPVDEKPPEDAPPKDDKEPAGGAKRKKKKE